MTTRQKITALMFILVMILIGWQVMGMFKNRTTVTKTVATVKTAAKTPTPVTMSPNLPANASLPPAVAVPPPAPLAISPQVAAMTQREAELAKLQQETQARYVATLNELQMLRLAREIAETNQAIMAAKLATVTAQKGIVNLLSRPAVPENYTQGMGGAPTPSPPTTAEPSYVVISVSQLRYKWNAVLGFQGSLFNVSIGDILPPDGSKVVSIDKSGVVLLKNGARKKISLVPII